MLVVFLAWCLVVKAMGESNGANQNCADHARVRREWSTWSVAEKRRFRQALADSMDSGIYYDFYRMHHNSDTYDLSHKSCLFSTWHRAFVFGFENHLRALKPEYACLTLPIWDVSREVAHGGPMIDASPIVTELCGNPALNAPEYNYVQTEYQNKSAYVYDAFPCNHSQPGPVLRGHMGERKQTPRAGYLNLANMYVFEDEQEDTYEGFHDNLFGSAHAYVHATIGGHMSTADAPLDPLFYVWHATVDAYASLYSRCKFGDRSLTEEEQKTDPYAYSPCHASETPSTAVLDMYLPQLDTGELVHVSQHARVARFFEATGFEYYRYVDHSTLGDFTYSYGHVPELLQAMDPVFQLESCPGTNRPSDSVSESDSDSYSEPDTPMEDDTPMPEEEEEEEIKTDTTEGLDSASSESTELDSSTDMYEQWSSIVRDELEVTFEDPRMVLAQSALMECVAYYQTNPETPAYSSVFLDDRTEDRCHSNAQAIIDGEEKSPLDMDGFEASKVTPREIDPKDVKFPNLHDEVIDETPKETNTSAQSSTVSSGLIFGCVFGALAVLAVIGAAIRKARDSEDEEIVYEGLTPTSEFLTL